MRAWPTSYTMSSNPFGLPFIFVKIRTRSLFREADLSSIAEIFIRAWDPCYRPERVSVRFWTQKTRKVQPELSLMGRCSSTKTESDQRTHRISSVSSIVDGSSRAPSYDFRRLSGLSSKACDPSQPLSFEHFAYGHRTNSDIGKSFVLFERPFAQVFSVCPDR